MERLQRFTPTMRGISGEMEWLVFRLEVLFLFSLQMLILAPLLSLRAHGGAP